jgi:hypothetical protein
MTPRTQQPKSKAAASKLVAVAKSPAKSHVAINVDVPIDIHRRFRIVALEQDMTLAEAIVAAMDDWARPG